MSIQFVRGLLGGLGHKFISTGDGDVVQAVFDISSTGTQAGASSSNPIYAGQTVKSEASVSVLDDGIQYISGSVIGSLMTFNAAVRASGVGGVLKSVKVTSSLPIMADLKLFLFRVSPLTTIENELNFEPQDGDLARIEAIVHITTGSWNVLPNNSIAEVECSKGIDTHTDDLYGALVNCSPTTLVLDTSNIITYLNVLSD